jgi:hypothetical protein
VVAGALHLRYAAFRAPVRLVLGPTLVLNPGPVRVELGAREVFRIPAVVLGWVIEAEFGPI